MTTEKTYIGDSVYARMVGGMIELTTDNGFGPSNIILLDREVWQCLTSWLGHVELMAKEGMT